MNFLQFTTIYQGPIGRRSILCIEKTFPFLREKPLPRLMKYGFDEGERGNFILIFKLNKL